jgi:hypothetical protein
MVLTSQQASETLSEVAAAQRKASVLQGYAKSAPHFFLWGLVWAVGYAGTEVYPTLVGPLWMVLDIIGVAGSFLLSRAAAAPEVRAQRSANFLVLALAITTFMGATYYVMRPHTSAQYGAFPPLILAFIYTFVGTRAGTRWVVIGTALWLLTVVGYALVREHFMLWMAFVGGGALLLTGVWMRRV